MKKPAVTLAVILLSAAAFNAMAAENAPASARSVEKLLVASHSQNLSLQIQQQMADTLAREVGQMNISANERPIVDRYTKQMATVVSTELAWDKFKPDLVKLYSQTFTEKEIIDLTRFYESDTGQSFVKKLPQLTQATMLLMQQKVGVIQPKIQEIARHMVQELQAQRAKTPAAAPKK